MQDNRSQKTAGGNEPGLSIIIEGENSKLVAELSDLVSKKLDSSSKKSVQEGSLRSREENILTANQYLLDTTAAALAPATLSLLVVIKLRERLKRTQAFKAEGKYVIGNTSWLGDAFYYEYRGKSEVAKQIIIDCGLMRPDVWVVIDEPHGVYTKLAKQAGVRVYSPKLAKSKLVEAILEHIEYGQKKLKKPTAVQEVSQKTPEIKTKQLETQKLSELAIHASDRKLVAIKQNDTKIEYYLPPQLGDKVLGAYKIILDKIISNYSEITKKLNKKKLPPDTVEAITERLKPLAVLVDIERLAQKTAEISAPDNLDSTISQVLASSIPQQLDGAPEANIELTSFSPRNEIDFAIVIAFALSDKPSRDIQTSIENLTISDKEDIVLNYLKAGHKNILKDARYTFDILGDYVHLRKIRELIYPTIVAQNLSPRYGFETPEEIDNSEMADLFQQSFDLSLELYSLLQAAGFESEAQYAVLQGHKLRFRISLTASDLRKLLSEKYADDTYKKLLKEMRDKTAQVHPLIWTK